MSISQFLVGTSIASAVLYVIAAVVSSRDRKASGTPRDITAYLMGFLFSALYLWAIPLLWFRYGARATASLYGVCVAFTMGGVAALRLAGADISGFVESLFFGQLVLVLIRPAVGVWLSKRDRQWREANVLRRGNSSAASSY